MPRALKNLHKSPGLSRKNKKDDDETNQNSKKSTPKIGRALDDPYTSEEEEPPTEEELAYIRAQQEQARLMEEKRRQDEELEAARRREEAMTPKFKHMTFNPVPNDYVDSSDESMPGIQEEAEPEFQDLDDDIGIGSRSKSNEKSAADQIAATLEINDETAPISSGALSSLPSAKLRFAPGDLLPKDSVASTVDSEDFDNRTNVTAATKSLSAAKIIAQQAKFYEGAKFNVDRLCRNIDNFDSNSQDDDTQNSQEDEDDDDATTFAGKLKQAHKLLEETEKVSKSALDESKPLGIEHTESVGGEVFESKYADAYFEKIFAVGAGKGAETEIKKDDLEELDGIEGQDTVGDMPAAVTKSNLEGEENQLDDNASFISRSTVGRSSSFKKSNTMSLADYEAKLEEEVHASYGEKFMFEGTGDGASKRKKREQEQLEKLAALENKSARKNSLEDEMTFASPELARKLSKRMSRRLSKDGQAVEGQEDDILAKLENLEKGKTSSDYSSPTPELARRLTQRKISSDFSHLENRQSKVETGGSSLSPELARLMEKKALRIRDFEV